MFWKLLRLHGIQNSITDLMLDLSCKTEDSTNDIRNTVVMERNLYVASVSKVTVSDLDFQGNTIFMRALSPGYSLHRYKNKWVVR